MQLADGESPTGPDKELRLFIRLLTRFHFCALEQEWYQAVTYSLEIGPISWVGAQYMLFLINPADLTHQLKDMDRKIEEREVREQEAEIG